jgi:hypothetical protein
MAHEEQEVEVQQVPPQGELADQKQDLDADLMMKPLGMVPVIALAQGLASELVPGQEVAEEFVPGSEVVEE